MRVISFFAVSALLLAGCATTNHGAVNSQASAMNQKLYAEAAQSARSVEIGGQTYRVTLFMEGNYIAAVTDTSFEEFVLKKNGQPFAIVMPTDSAVKPYRAADIEAAARRVSGCSASFDGGVLEFIGTNLEAADLAGLSTKISDFKGWRANLSC